MDMPETEGQEKMNLSISLHFVYGFLTLLGICILFSLLRAIYHFYKRAEHNDISEGSATTQSHSVSNESLVSERPENNVSESDRLNLQLDKLRRLLNRLNAMGTFSRDTIGDISEQTAANLNNSRQASSDLSEFWSSIDFDEFEDSIINESNFQKTQTENSFSVSDFSLDTSGMNFNNFGHNNMPVSLNKCVRKVPLSQTNPSEAIAQILTILDSIMLKNRHDVHSSEKNELPNGINVKESTHLGESHVPQRLDHSSLISMDRTLTSTSDSMCSATLITMPEPETFDISKCEAELINNTLTSKLKLLDDMSQAIESKTRTSSVISMEAKLSKGISVVNITSGSKNLVKRLSSSSKSIDARKLSLSRSVALCIDPNECLSTKAISISESAALSRESILKKNAIFKNVSVKDFQRKYPCTLEALNRTHSLSTLLAKKLPLQSIQPCFIKSCSNVMEYEANFPVLKTNAEISTKNSELCKSSKKLSARNVEVLETKSVNCKTLNNKNNSRSSRILHSPIVTSRSLKLSTSESEINQSPFLESFSSNLTPSNSEAFLSPAITESMSSRENVDWKSPIEPHSVVYLSQNLTPHSENTFTTTNSCIWSTPPSPK